MMKLTNYVFFFTCFLFSFHPLMAQYKLIWNDEFTGIGAPDNQKWDRQEYNRRNNAEGPDGWWSNEDSYLDGKGNLVIRVRKVDNKNNDNDPYDYSTGMVHSKGKFEQRYGRFECRCQLPTQQGWWVAFWMMQGDVHSVGNGGVDGQEVDIMEGWGWTNSINQAFHWDGYGDEHQSIDKRHTIDGLSEGYHTYRLDWFPDEYVFYVDGHEVWRNNGGGVCNKPGYVKITGELSTEAWAINDLWAKNPVEASYPDSFLIDYVRVYDIDTIQKSCSGNPFIRHLRGADPSAQVWDDGQVWVYASHDQDNAEDYSTMDGYRAYSSYDLVHWTDHGEILHSRDVSWGREEGGFMFAPDAAYKDGVYYLYYPHMSAANKWQVGVATSLVPEGPFEDQGYLPETDEIDPCCFIDDDGQAYLIWGGASHSPKIGKLKDNMLEFAETPREIQYNSDNFGEGPYMHKYNGKYYFSWTCNTCYPVQSYYAIGDSPYGPFEYKGGIKDAPPGAQDHHSMIEYHGQWYYFYHTGNFGNESSLFRRNLCVDSMFYNPDGTIQEVIQTEDGVSADFYGSIEGFALPGKVEAELAHTNSGKVKTDAVELNDQDALVFVLEVPIEDQYTLTLLLDKVTAKSNLEVRVDELMIGTLELDNVNASMSVPLHRGKHLLTLKSIGGSANSLIQLDGFELQFQSEIIKVKAQSGEGGSMKPEGELYVKKGSSIDFTIKNDLGYRMTNFEDQGLIKISSQEYTLSDITNDAELMISFEPCTADDALASVLIDNTPQEVSRFYVLDEGQSIEFKVEAFDTPWWTYPNSDCNEGESIKFQQVKAKECGRYVVDYLNEEECQSQVDFEMTVIPFESDVYEAEDFNEQHGIDTQSTNDIGGGDNVGWIENNDWMTYTIEILEDGSYDFFARVSTGGHGGDIELLVDGTVMATLTINPSLSTGWQDWFTTASVPVSFTKGIHEVTLRCKGGGGYLFNLNWFDLQPSIASHNQKIDGLNHSLRHLLHDSIFSVAFTLVQDATVSMSVYDLNGSKLGTMIEHEQMKEGVHHRTSTEIGQLLSKKTYTYLLVFDVDGQRTIKKFLK